MLRVPCEHARLASRPRGADKALLCDRDVMLLVGVVYTNTNELTAIERGLAGLVAWRATHAEDPCVSSCSVMDILPPEFRDFGVFRRLIFVASQLPEDVPQYWELVARFASQGMQQCTVGLQPESVKLVIENLKALDPQALLSDKLLLPELHSIRLTTSHPRPVGIIFVSPHSTCGVCGDTLLVRNDRPSNLIVYTESFGTMSCSHFVKFCRKFRKGCKFRQYYGYSSKNGKEDENIYDSDWAEHNYFISTSDTAFETTMLKKYDAELLLGQLSYKQKAEIYNLQNGYPAPPKKCSSMPKDKPVPTDTR